MDLIRLDGRISHEGIINVYISEDRQKYNKYPDMKGSVTIPIELIEYMQAYADPIRMPITGVYGYKFDISLWENRDFDSNQRRGDFSGYVTPLTTRFPEKIRAYIREVIWARKKHYAK